MNSQKTHGKKKAAPREFADYFGLTVEIILKMSNYSLIRWRDRASIVETQDLLIVAQRGAA